MIENWKQAYKFYVMWALAIIATVSELAQMYPEIAAQLPEHWVALAVALAAFVRLLAQTEPTQSERLAEAARKAGIAFRKGSTLLVLLCLGCAGREACYARNDAEFLEVVDDCDDAGFTYEECPWIPEAERIQKAKDGRCP